MIPSTKNKKRSAIWVISSSSDTAITSTLDERDEFTVTTATDYISNDISFEYSDVTEITQPYLSYKEMDDAIRKDNNAYFNGLLLDMSKRYQYSIVESDFMRVIGYRKCFMRLKTFRNIRRL